jgi:hypothetical protein
LRERGDLFFDLFVLSLGGDRIALVASPELCCPPSQHTEEPLVKRLRTVSTEGAAGESWSDAGGSNAPVAPVAAPPAAAPASKAVVAGAVVGATAPDAAPPAAAAAAPTALRSPSSGTKPKPSISPLSTGRASGRRESLAVYTRRERRRAKKEKKRERRRRRNLIDQGRRREREKKLDLNNTTSTLSFSFSSSLNSPPSLPQCSKHNFHFSSFFARWLMETEEKREKKKKKGGVFFSLFRQSFFLLLKNFSLARAQSLSPSELV